MYRAGKISTAAQERYIPNTALHATLINPKNHFIDALCTEFIQRCPRVTLLLTSKWESFQRNAPTIAAVYSSATLEAELENAGSPFL